MTSTRRSLFVIGVVLPMLALFASTAAFAQVPDNDATAGNANLEVPADVTAGTVQGHYDKLNVTWTIPTPAPTAPDPAGTFQLITSFEVGYVKTAKTSTAMTFGAASPTVVPVLGGRGTTSFLLTDLDASSRYIVGVRGVGGATAPNKGPWAHNATTAANAVAMTGTPPKPGDVDSRDIVLVEGDGQLMLTWRSPTPGSSAGTPDVEIESYMVRYGMEEDLSDSTTTLTVMSEQVTISNLENGEMYYVQIKAKNDQGGVSANWSKAVSGTPMAGAMLPTPTPALPIFGAFALGAGLLAAGRARLRRREQRQLTR